jgi:YbbR domain-containing protein
MDRLRQLLEEAGALLRGVVWPVAASVRGNLGLAAFSVVLGFALWIFVTDTESPTRSGILPFDLEVEAVNRPGDLALATSLVKVRVKVEVADDVWNTLSPADFKATTDLEGLQAGTYDQPVRVEALTGRGGLRVTQVIPATVEVDLRSLFSKSVPVNVKLEGSPAPGYEAGAPETDVETVLVTGTQDKVTQVSQVVAALDITGRTEDVAQAVRLDARDALDTLVDGVFLEPSVVNVSVKITHTEYSAPLAIRPTVTGSPADGYEVVSVSVDPAVATALGPPSFIAEAAALRTQPVDISGATDDVVLTVSLDLPPDVSVSGSTSVTVTVVIDPSQGRRTLAVTAVAVGLDPSLSLSGALPFVEVELLGELPTLRDLLPNDIAATVNLTGLKAGTHTVKVTVSAPADAVVASISPETVDIKLEAR